jgi:cobalt-zinc-cadmium efflux system outer membrane protein
VFVRTIGPVLLMAVLVFAQEGPLRIERPPDPRRQKAAERIDPIEPRKPLTLEEALDLADEYNPRLKAATASIEGAQAGILTARAYINPDVTIGGFGGQRAIQNSTIPGGIQGFSFNQPLELPSVRKTRIHTAELGRESSRFALAETRLGVRASVKQAFYEALRRKGEMDLAQGNLQLLEDLQRRIGVQVNVGEAARLELVRADAEVSTACIQLQSSRLRLTSALSVLHAAIGAPLDRQIDPQGVLDAAVLLPSLDVLRKEVLARHPAVALAENETRRANARLDLERALVKPQPTVWADMFRQPDAAQYRIGVTLPIPLWNKREGPIAEAVAAEHQASAVADLRRLEIRSALESAYGQYEVASQQVAMFESGTLRQAEAAVQAAEAAFRFGERGIIEVLDAQRVLRGARLDYLNAQFDREAALIDLEQLGVVDLGSGKP